MSWHSEALDELAMEADETARHARHCNCPRCRSDRATLSTGGCGCGDHSNESGGIWTTGAARNQTPPQMGGSQLPLWRNWTPPVTLATLRRFRQLRRWPPELAPFFTTRGNRVYRITRAGRDINAPLSIGFTRETIALRVIRHKDGRRGDPNVTRALQGVPDGRILVQAAVFAPSRDPHARQAHLYKVWLQHRERPVLYSPNTTTFDEAARRNPAPRHEEA